MDVIAEQEVGERGQEVLFGIVLAQVGVHFQDEIDMAIPFPTTRRYLTQLRRYQDHIVAKAAVATGMMIVMTRLGGRERCVMLLLD